MQCNEKSKKGMIYRVPGLFGSDLSDDEVEGDLSPPVEIRKPFAA